MSKAKTYIFNPELRKKLRSKKKTKEEIRINKSSFCGTNNHFWVVSYNTGGIGTPIADVNKDIKYFIKKALQKERERIIEEIRDVLNYNVNQWNLEECNKESLIKWLNNEFNLFLDLKLKEAREE